MLLYKMIISPMQFGASQTIWSELSFLPVTPVLTLDHWRVFIELYQPQMWGRLKSHASAAHLDPIEALIISMALCKAAVSPVR